MGKPRRWLKNLRLNAVALVPAGANPGAHIALVKEEKTARDMEEKLRAEIAQFGSDDLRPWLVDWTDSWIVYELNDQGFWKRPYVLGEDGTVAFGEAAEVERQTSYVTKQDMEDLLSSEVEKFAEGESSATLLHFTPEDVQYELTGGGESSVYRRSYTFTDDGTFTFTEPVKVDPEADPDALKELSMTDPTTAELEKAREDAEAAKAEVEAELAKARAEADELREQVEKAKTEAEADVRKELDEAKEQLASVLKRQRTDAFVAKAGVYKNLGAAEEIAPLLMEADEHFSDEAKATLDQLLAGADKQVEEGALFKQFSRDGGEGPATWEEKLNEAARDRVAKGTSETVEQAKVAIMREDRELRAEYEQSVRS